MEYTLELLIYTIYSHFPYDNKGNRVKERRLMAINLELSLPITKKQNIFIGQTAEGEDESQAWATSKVNEPTQNNFFFYH